MTAYYIAARITALEAASPDDIRAEGWAVAVHNDYRLNGVNHTFWLFTKGERCVKGEGRTDAEALAEVRHSLSDRVEAATADEQRATRTHRATRSPQRCDIERQGDEEFCRTCARRWDAGDEPPCNLTGRSITL